LSGDISDIQETSDKWVPKRPAKHPDLNGDRRTHTRLTNAFSKKVENHCHALAIYFMHYNYVRIHQNLRVIPAMAAGVSKTLWSMDDVVKIVEEWEAARDGSGT
jgi:hypothetical protein